jgi:cytidylate kinase
MTRAPVVAIDGPSGSGKGTISQLLAQRLGWHYLDSGALYRLVALAALRRGVALDDAAGLSALARALEARFSSDPAQADKIYLEGAEVSEELRGERCGNAASRVAAIPEVRAALLERQRAFRKPPGLVADGRDMGTVIFPDATLKIFLTATPEERARRRYKQLKDKGLDAKIYDLVKDIAERDARDSARAAAPLKSAPDAVALDTTDMSIEAVVERVWMLLRERFGESSCANEFAPTKL